MTRYLVPFLLTLSLAAPCQGDLVFYESMGTVTSNTLVPAHAASNGFDNMHLTMSGVDVDLRSTTVSTGYAGASGGANIFFANSMDTVRSFTISNLDTRAFQFGTLDLSFGAYKSTTASDLTQLAWGFSTNGDTFTMFQIPEQPTGSGTANWRLLTFLDTEIPIADNLSLRWESAGTTTSFRIDDIRLGGDLTAVPEPSSLWLGMLVMVATVGCVKRSRLRLRIPLAY